MRIDLNADLGESFGRWSLGDDPELMRSVTSANIACGFHAGDPAVMRETVRRARDAGVAAGAHPGLPDLAGFGRRWMAVSPRELEDLVLYQVGALAGIAAAEGVRLQHVKPHGALYTMAARDRALADALVRAVASIDRQLLLFAPPHSEMLRAADAAGLPTAPEAFADRAYDRDGMLMPRSDPGAVIHDPAEAAARAVRIVRDGVVTSADGHQVRLRVLTICIHGDTPGAAGLARHLRAALESAGIAVVRVGAPAVDRE